MIGDKDLSIPGRMLDFYALRQKLTAHNIANAEVPGFRRLEASFGDELLDAIRSGDPAKIRKVKLTVETATTPGVDVERETANMVKNELLFDTFTQIAAYQGRVMRMAIQSK